jgi:hypothetical protein
MTRVGSQPDQLSLIRLEGPNLYELGCEAHSNNYQRQVGTLVHWFVLDINY